MEYCKTSFLKIYPDGFRTDSSNQDVVQCWALGCQFCALNLQRTDDDCVLINKMFSHTTLECDCHMSIEWRFKGRYVIYLWQ